jgi:glucosyl-3-phosphoglycerate phosphatase
MREEPTFITFVRHGQSLSNVARRWEGHGDSALSELGRQQASLLGERLRRGRFQHVFTSDLVRAVDTARATGLPFETFVELREIDVGRWAGLTSEELAVHFPDELDALKKGEDVRRGGGESYAGFSIRVDAILGSLRARLAPGDHALVVCHGGFIATALARMLGLGGPMESALGHASNTAISTISYTSAGARLHVFNDSLHLLPLGSWPSHAASSGTVGLVCDTLAANCFGAFAACYDDTEHSLALVDAEALSARLSELQGRHPAQRVALSARAATIRACVERTLWPKATAEGSLEAPPTGSISHVTRHENQLWLLDYGIGALGVV